jgi:3-hydroxyisobutyrate dehydrogenase
MQRVALLGIGIMGSGMAANWIKKGFALTVYNRTRSKAEPFAEMGAKVANTPREAAEDADIIVSMVTDDNASRAVWFGEDGALLAVKPGKIVIESSTVTPNWVRELAKHVQDRGGDMLDVPVAGSKFAAADGQLVMLAGGDADVLEKARPALEAVSRRIAHIGVIGMGATWKLINNMMSAVHVAALTEGLALAKRSGVDLETAADLIKNGPSASPMVNAKLPRMLEHRYADTEFSLSNMLKDVNYAAAMGDQFGVPLSVVKAAGELLQRAVDQGYGDQDMASAAEAYKL